MAQERQENKPVKLNLDVSNKYLPTDSAFFMLNNERNLVSKKMIGKNTPMPSNYQACDMYPMVGDPNSVGTHRDPITNEAYSWTLNDGGLNYLLRVNQEGCQIVYTGDNSCLPLSANPKHAIKQFRAYLKYEKLCAHRHGKAIVWTDGLNDIGMIDVQASIATNYFTTPFFDLCPDPCCYTKMCVPLLCKKLEGEFITLDADEVDLTNHLVDVAFQVCYRHIYYDGRISEWMGVSTTYFQDSKGCFDSSEGFPRCMKFRMPVGNPLVDRIEIAVRRDNELFTDGLSPLWRSVEVIEKYKPYSTQEQMWYERELEDLLNFSTDDCCFDYIFCNDKECNPIDVAETNRVYNPIPREAQGLIRIKDALGFYNYKKGNCPISGTEAKKFEISLDCVDDNCPEELATVTVYAIIHSGLKNRNGFVYRVNGASINSPDDKTDPASFGSTVVPDGYGQTFKGDIRNFIAYVEGTNYWAPMKQFQSDAFFVNKTEVGILSGLGNITNLTAVLGSIDSGNFYFQKYELKVPKGTKGFIRIANQKSINGLPEDGQLTSTFVAGTVADIHGYYGTIDISGVISSYKEELYFDTCAGDVILDETLIIEDEYRIFESGAHTSSAYSGYLTDADNQPVPGGEIWYDGIIRSICDFNGFYHFALYGDENIQTINVNVRVETDCGAGYHDVKTVTLAGGYSLNVQTNIQITDADAPGYKTNFYETVNIPVKDCDNLPVGGVRIALSGSKYKVTDAVTGIATFKVRNYSTRTRSVRAVVLDSNNCFSQDCSNNCNPCIPSTNNTALSACFSGTPSISISPTTALNKLSALLNKKGLKAGGRYPFGIVIKGDCGRLSSVYPVTILNGSVAMLDNYLDVPKTQEKSALSFCNIKYNGAGMVLPDWANCVSIVRGTNVNNFQLQWVIDKIERTTSGKIKLTIQSLNDYNATYNFETNTVYQYQKNDRVEFISNGDGSIFDTTTFGLLNYQILSPFHDKVISGQTAAPANYFNQILIDDDGKLDTLTVGAKIELQRPADCTVEPTYYEVHSIPLVEISGQNVLSIPSDEFETFDTFIVNRQIGTNPAQQFEHHSPSDFWGNRIDDTGKVHFVNRFENEQRFGRNISINSPTHFNIFGYIEKTFDSPEHGDLTAIGIYDSRIGLAISEHDNSLFQVSDDLARVASDGIIHAASPDSIISDGEPKVSGAFGCQYPHIGSVYFGDGYVMYWDVNKSAYVKHDFNIARDISAGKAKLYFDKRGQFVETFNKTTPTEREMFRMSTGFNFNTGAVMITVKSLVQGGTYNGREAFSQTNDTILFNPETEDFLTFAGFVPEEYSNLDLYDGNGCAFIGFQNGIPWIFPKIALSDNDYNSFFGVPTDWIFGISINSPFEKIKIPIGFEIVASDKFFISKVVTDKVGFESEVPVRRIKPFELHFNGSFLFDKNSRGGLFGIDPRTAGTPARGNWIAVTFVRDNTISEQYNTINPDKMRKFGEQDTFIFKSEISEQSGMTGNL